jgi:hypothetical protein
MGSVRTVGANVDVGRCLANNGGHQCVLTMGHREGHNYDVTKSLKVVTDGIKFDSHKLRWHLLPWNELEQVVAALDHGATKYDEFNWSKVIDEPGGVERYLSAAMRHLKARAVGQHRDPDSGLPHLAHAVCCLLFIMWSDHQ